MGTGQIAPGRVAYAGIICGILKITVDDLLNGAVVSPESHDERAKALLLKMVEEKEVADKRLLSAEIVIGVISALFLAAMIAVGAVFKTMAKPLWTFYLPVGVGLAQFLVAMTFALRIEQIAGYYECAKCGHRYVPGFAKILFSMHVNRTRFMKCPHCG